MIVLSKVDKVWLKPNKSDMEHAVCDVIRALMNDNMGKLHETFIKNTRIKDAEHIGNREESYREFVETLRKRYLKLGDG